MQLIFHIGLHKTGTSFLQQRLFANVRNATYLRAEDSLMDWLSRGEGKVDRLLISSESLSGEPWGKRLERSEWCQMFQKNIQRLSLVSENSIIVLGIREHKGMILSLFKQYLHEGGTMGISPRILTQVHLNRIFKKELELPQEIAKYIDEKFSQDWNWVASHMRKSTTW